MFATRMVVAAAVLVLGAGLLRADYESDLLDKYAKQGQTAEKKWRQEVEAVLGQAATLRKTDPDKAIKLLRKSLDALEADAALPTAERTTLAGRLRDGLSAATALVDAHKRKVAESKLEAARSELASEAPRKKSLQSEDDERSRKPVLVTPVPINAGFSTTPVVLPDRRWVRIGVRGTFSVPNVTGFQAVPVLTPTVLQGPGRNLTVVPPVGLRYALFPLLTFTTGTVNTTVMAPDGGSAFVGGSSSSYEARVESGAPGLSAVPYLNRLFRNTAYGSSSSGFRISVSPRIIDLAEEDARALGK